MSDPRFTRLRTDPRFRRPKKNKQKVVVDERFKAIFEDDGSKKKKSKSGRVDKYGRSISDTHEKEDLRRFYRLEGQEDEDVKDAQDKNEQMVDYARGQVLLESSDEENNDDQSANQESDVDDGEVILGRHASKPIPVLAEDEDEYLEVDLNEDGDAYADLDAQAVAYIEQHAINIDGAVNGEEPDHTGIKTNRIAVVNLDWDHVRASHLFKIFSSLVSPTAPSAAVAVNATTASTITSANDRDRDEKTSSAAKIIRGKVLSVRVYPSEFGKERLRREEEEGPPKEIYKKSRRDDVLGSLVQEDEGDPYDEKALRKYQLERLRYYYAIVTCDTVEAAVHIVSELDGTELERSANVFDLSFVPDDMTFDDDFRDEATPATEVSSTTLKPLDFSTDALRHSRVTLKWDEDDPERNKVLRRTLSRKEIEEDDFRAYIASSSSEDEEEENEIKKGNKSKAERERLRKLLLGGGGANDQEDANPFVDEDKGAEGDVEITFMPGLSEANANAGEETTIEAYRRKQKEKRLARKKEKKEEEDQGGNKEKDAESKKNKSIDDDFFAAGSESENSEEGKEDMDSHKNSKKSKSTKVREKGSEASADVETRPATEAELSLLVAPDDVSSERKHFDMKAVLKAEKVKRKKRDRKKKDKGAGGEDENEIQEDFQIDVKDERFKALHEDHTFAIDPSNPHFKKTKSMAALLEERARRQFGKESVSGTKTNSPRNGNSAPSQSLQSLVESVKRKSSGVEEKGVGKRRKL
ncbi:ESF1 [Sanghuangporus weigelae]